MVDLPSSELHTWVIDTNDNHFFQKYYDVLSKEEKERGQKFLFDSDSNNFLISHIATRLILSKYIKCLANQIVFGYHKYGKPYILNEDRTYFNLSHSGQKAVIAIYEKDVGVDIEHVNRELNIKDIAEFAFNKQELFRFNTFSGHNQKKEFFKLWTKKEAILKAKGTGLFYDLKNTDISNYYTNNLDLNHDDYVAAISYKKSNANPAIIYQNFTKHFSIT